MSDPLFPYASHPAPGMAPTGPRHIDHRNVRYPQGLFNQLPYRPYNATRRTPAPAPPPPPPRLGVCPRCALAGVRSHGDRKLYCPVCDQLLT